MRGLSDEDIDALAMALESRLETKLSDKIVDSFEERVTGKLQQAAGKWLFGILMKSVVTALLAFGAYTFGKNGGAG